MNQQEIFTKVKNHLLTQNKRSIDPLEGCMYRGPNGLMCAVGCLIPDELYSKTIEGTPVSHLPSSFIRFLGDENAPLLLRLQNIHDHRLVDQWEHSLRDLATEYNLEF